MNKKIIIVSSLFIIAFSSIVGCSKYSKGDTKNLDSIDKKSITPISKSTVLNILKAEYGDNILVKNEDIKLIGDLYFVDVYVEIEDSEEKEDNENHETQIHRQSLGTKKIDKYTGEIIEE